MRRLLMICIFVLLTLSIGTMIVSAQDSTPASTTCSTFVNQALTDLSANCGGLSRNTACYGYNSVKATFMQALAPDAFSHPNDRVDLAALQSITTAPLDPALSQWGIAVLKAQADLPDALPGQAVTFLLLGDVHLKTGVEQGSDMKPMQAVYFTTGIGQTRCSDAPDPSLIIQGPQDITINLRVNGADIKLSSTLMFQSADNNSMACGVLDGHAVVGKAGQIIPAGFASQVPLDNTLNTNGTWSANAPMPDHQMQALQMLKDLPPGMMNYAPDVPTPDEVNLMAVMDNDMLAALPPHTMRAMVRLLLMEGATPDIAAQWENIPAMTTFFDTHFHAVQPTDLAQFPDTIHDDVMTALNNYAASQGN